MTVDKAGSPLTASENIVPDTRHGVILYVEDVNLSFDGFKALNNLNLYINDGELRCLIGANGAGKTTLMDVITGKIRPDSGKVNFGQKVDLLQLDESEMRELVLAENSKNRRCLKRCLCLKISNLA